VKVDRRTGAMEDVNQSRMASRLWQRPGCGSWNSAATSKRRTA
jgi:hypothetical protein